MCGWVYLLVSAATYAQCKAREAFFRGHLRLTAFLDFAAKLDQTLRCWDVAPNNTTSSSIRPRKSSHFLVIRFERLLTPLRQSCNSSNDALQIEKPSQAAKCNRPRENWQQPLLCCLTEELESNSTAVVEASLCAPRYSLTSGQPGLCR